MNRVSEKRIGELLKRLGADLTREDFAALCLA